MYKKATVSTCAIVSLCAIGASFWAGAQRPIHPCVPEKGAYMCVQSVTGGNAYYKPKMGAEWATIPPFDGTSNQKARKLQLEIENGDEFYLDKSASAKVYPYFKLPEKPIGNANIRGIDFHEPYRWEIPQIAFLLTNEDFRMMRIRMRIIGRDKGDEAADPSSIAMPGPGEDVGEDMKVYLRANQNPTSLSFKLNGKILDMIPLGDPGREQMLGPFSLPKMDASQWTEGDSVPIELVVGFQDRAPERRSVQVHASKVSSAKGGQAFALLTLLTPDVFWEDAADAVTEGLGASGSASEFIFELRRELQTKADRTKILSCLRGNKVGVALEDVASALELSEPEFWRILSS